MADIKIQPKKPSPISYVLYAIALIAIVYMIIRSVTASKHPVQLNPVVVDTTKVAGSVKEFVGFLEDTSRVDTPKSPAYTSYGLYLLSAAIGATTTRDAANDHSMVQKSTRLQQLADSIQYHYSPIEKSTRVKPAFLKASELMKLLQEKNYPKLKDQSQVVQKSAEAIDPNEEVRNQTPKIKQFFQQSAALLQGMVKQVKTEEAGK